jgi:hypothetical protein
MRTEKESKELADVMINIIHKLLSKNNLFIAIKDKKLFLLNHDTNKFYQSKLG